ncbi:unnamed protein product [Cylindrotheca closterium]|uniref:Uncharacterized protein n=1 Tax=Cylindrotheca closterium TaxID=2856 RepID=A0AAD2FK35_9STRA|nr:unnamed protein product [Cylindrotheca closterium]
MTITDFTVRKKSYHYLTTQASYPNHDSKAVLDAFDPTKDLQLQDLNSLVEKGVQGGAPAWYTTVGEKKEQHFDKLYVLDHDVLENGSDPLAFSWPAKAFSKTDPGMVPKLEAWLINEELEQDRSKLFVMEDITDEDPETAYNLLVTRKQMPIPKEFLDITWDGLLAHEVLRLVIDRIKILANSKEPEKNSEMQLLKNVGEPAVLTATSARRWVSRVINLDFAGLDSEDSTGDSSNKTYELLTKTLAAVEESNKTTKTSVESLSEVVVAGIQGQASDKVPPNTVEKKWPTRLSYLKRVAGTTTSAQLPTLWHELAKCKKHKSIGIVQSLLDDEAGKLNLNLEFIVSARVIKSLVELELCLRGDIEKDLNVFNSVCFQHYKNANAINDYNKSNYWLTGKKTTASMKDHQAHNKIKHAIFPKDPMQFCLQRMWIQLHERWECPTPSRSEHSRDFSLESISKLIVTEHLVRSGTNAEENLPDLGTYMETCYHGGSLQESNLFVVAKDTVGHGGTGDKTESQFKREKQRAQKKSLGESEKNPDMNEEHRYTGRTTTELIKRTGEQPPKHANGKELCLIWHTKGECKEHCERKHSHYDAAPDIDKLPHPAAPMLHRVMKNGAPVVVHSEPWSQSQLDMRVARRCHS